MQSNNCYLTVLPAELRCTILQFVEQDNNGSRTIRTLSQTCTYFFHLFKQRLYHTATFGADRKSGRSILRLSAGPHATLVKRLIFRARDPRPAWEQKHDARHQLSIPSKQVFLFLHRFSNLVEVELDVEWKLDLWFSDHPEPRLYPVNGYSETYRVILDQALRSLGRSVQHNNARVLPKLTLRNLPPRTYRALHDHTLHTLLNDLRSFHIELPDHGRPPLPPAHNRFISNLDTYFLNHLNNVRTLYLQCNPGSLIGESHGTPAIGFSKVKMRYLRKLTLCNYILSKETDIFISRHLSSLSSVALINCYRDQNWTTLLRRITSKKPSKLTNFEVSRLHNPLAAPSNNQLQLDTTSGSTPKHLQTFPGVRVFCGHIWESPEDEEIELAEGHSQLAWDRLQNVVQANKQCWERFTQSRSYHHPERHTLIA